MPYDLTGIVPTQVALVGHLKKKLVLGSGSGPAAAAAAAACFCSLFDLWGEGCTGDQIVLFLPQRWYKGLVHIVGASLSRLGTVAKFPQGKPSCMEPRFIC